MNICRRAYLYIVRKREKSLLLLLIFTILMLLVLVGNGIGQSAESAEAKLREEIGGYFKVAVNYEKAEINEIVNEELVKKVSEIDGIQKVNRMQTTYLTTSELILKESKNTLEGNMEKAKLTSFIGNEDTSLHEYFRLKLLRLEEGRHIRESDIGKALISEEVAEVNGLSVGDSFTAIISIDEYPRSEAIGEEFEFEIVGLFSDTTNQEGDAWTEERFLPANYIFIDFTTSQKISGMADGSLNIYNTGVLFYVEAPKELTNIVFSIKNTPEIDWESLKITENNYNYKKNAVPLEQLSSMTRLLVVLVTVIGMVLIALLLILWERDRIHEVGVLMSIGVAKRNILLQHFLESLVIYVIAFLLAVTVSKPLSNILGNSFYEESKTKVEESLKNATWISMYEPMDLSLAESEMELESDITLEIAILSGITGLIIVIVSVVLSFISILRRDPGEIMVIME